MEENEEELKSLLMRVKEESEKAGLKLPIWKTKIMASCPITSWQIDGDGGNGNSDRLFSWAPKSLWMVTAAMKLKDACFLEFKRHLLLGKKATNLASVLKSRDTTLTKVCIIKTMVFPIVMYRCES